MVAPQFSRSHLTASSLALLLVAGPHGARSRPLPGSNHVDHTAGVVRTVHELPNEPLTIRGLPTVFKARHSYGVEDEVENILRRGGHVNFNAPDHHDGHHPIKSAASQTKGAMHPQGSKRPKGKKGGSRSDRKWVDVSSGKGSSHHHTAGQSGPQKYPDSVLPEDKKGKHHDKKKGKQSRPFGKAPSGLKPRSPLVDIVIGSRPYPPPSQNKAVQIVNNYKESQGGGSSKKSGSKNVHVHKHIHEHIHDRRGLLGDLIKPLLAPLTEAIPGFVTVTDLLFGKDGDDTHPAEPSLLGKLTALVLKAQVVNGPGGPGNATNQTGSAIEDTSNSTSASNVSTIAYRFMASKNEKTQVFLVPIAPPTAGNSTVNSPSASIPSAPSNSTMVVRIAIPLVDSLTGAGAAYCATFDLAPPSKLDLIECSNNPSQTSPVSGKSQRFLYTPSTGALDPLYEETGMISGIEKTGSASTPPSKRGSFTELGGRDDTAADGAAISATKQAISGSFPLMTGSPDTAHGESASLTPTDPQNHHDQPSAADIMPAAQQKVVDGVAPEGSTTPPLMDPATAAQASTIIPSGSDPTDSADGSAVPPPAPIPADAPPMPSDPSATAAPGLLNGDDSIADPTSITDSTATSPGGRVALAFVPASQWSHPPTNQQMLVNPIPTPTVPMPSPTIPAATASCGCAECSSTIRVPTPTGAAAVV